jgi:hypothetical protein
LYIVLIQNYNPMWLFSTEEKRVPLSDAVKGK